MDRKVTYEFKCIADCITDEKLDGYRKPAALAETMLQEGSGPGNDYIGWLDLPENVSSQQIAAIQSTAKELRDSIDILICIGIGGSYLGAKAAIDFLNPAFEELRKPQVIFAGHHMNSDYLSDLLQLIEKKEVALNIISKSGTTTEPGITFRVLRKALEDRYGKKKSTKRIIATTDPKTGALRELAVQEKYTTFAIPPDVGGRYSVLTPVGLLPIAVSGIDIKALLSGAAQAISFCSGTTIEDNLSMQYAINRNILFREGKAIEVLASFQPQLNFIVEWWKQLTGESEGKDYTGIFPAILNYTTDLHSVGQWIQQGARNIFETFLYLKKTNTTIKIPDFNDNRDELQYLSGSSFELVNENAFRGTLLAHMDGGVPASIITVSERSAQALGQLFYFFEKAIALSGYLLRVNPFNQPGVEAYKKNMFALLSKPGYEDAGNRLKTRLKDMGL